MRRASGPAGRAANARNGNIAKTVQTGVGPVPLQVPRDRAGHVRAGAGAEAGRAGRRRPGRHGHQPLRARHVDRDIIHHLRQVYGTELSPETVSGSPTRCWRRSRAWQSRPLDPVYAVVFLDAIVVKVRDSQVVQNKPAYIAIGVDADGEKHVLGIWLSRTPPGRPTEGEGARFWGVGHGRPAQPRASATS